MNNTKLTGLGLRSGNSPLLMMTVVALSFGCHKTHVDDKDLRDFRQVNLVANTDEYRPVLRDSTLINGFGIAWSPTNPTTLSSIAWVNSVGGHVSELYSAEGAFVKRVNIPSPTDTIGGFPCGIVLSAGKGFNLSNGPATFLFTGFDGVLSGWNGGNNATLLRHPPSASYTGLALASNGGHNFIYGANFGQKKIDVWDTTFARVSMEFQDHGTPAIPQEYSPYNIQAVGDYLFVIYAQLAVAGDKNPGRGVAGPGKGFVSVFRPDGSFVKRFATRGTLNIPWGVTMAPPSFLQDQDMNDNGGGHGGYGESSASVGSASRQNNHDPKDPVVLVGNFGDGRVNVYAQDGQYLGQLQSHKKPIVIDGLWALSFAPTTSTAIDPARLYFTAGPDNENDGLFGYLIKQ